MLKTLRRHGIRWIGKTRVGKSAGSKTVAFTISEVEVL